MQLLFKKKKHNNYYIGNLQIIQVSLPRSTDSAQNNTCITYNTGYLQ